MSDAHLFTTPRARASSRDGHRRRLRTTLTAYPRANRHPRRRTEPRPSPVTHAPNATAQSHQCSLDGFPDPAEPERDEEPNQRGAAREGERRDRGRERQKATALKTSERASEIGGERVAVLVR